MWGTAQYCCGAGLKRTNCWDRNSLSVRIRNPPTRTPQLFQLISRNMRYLKKHHWKHHTKLERGRDVARDSLRPQLRAGLSVKGQDTTTLTRSTAHSRPAENHNIHPSKCFFFVALPMRRRMSATSMLCTLPCQGEKQLKPRFPL